MNWSRSQSYQVTKQSSTVIEKSIDTILFIEETTLYSDMHLSQPRPDNDLFPNSVWIRKTQYRTNAGWRERENVEEENIILFNILDNQAVRVLGNSYKLSRGWTLPRQILHSSMVVTIFCHPLTTRMWIPSKLNKLITVKVTTVNFFKNSLKPWSFLWQFSFP